MIANRLGILNGRVMKAVRCGIRDFIRDHPDAAINVNYTSLAKRVKGQLKTELSRLLLDKMMLDWMERHREEALDLFEKRGALRHLLALKLEEEHENETRRKVSGL